MATNNKQTSKMDSVEFLPELLQKSLKILGDLSMATGTASVEASIASARHLINLQRVSVKAGVGLVSKVQQYTEKSLLDAVKDGKWLPREGNEVIEEWTRMMQSGVDEFARVTDKSFELLLQYLDRVEKEKRPTPGSGTRKTSKPASTGKSKKAVVPAKKSVAKRKTAPRKKKATQPGK